MPPSNWMKAAAISLLENFCASPVSPRVVNETISTMCSIRWSTENRFGTCTGAGAVLVWFDMAFAPWAPLTMTDPSA